MEPPFKTLRGLIDSHPWLSTTGVLVTLAFALAFTLHNFNTDGRPPLESKSFYSIDDGRSYFADDQNKVVPFIKDGKEVARVVRPPAVDDISARLAQIANGAPRRE